MPSYQSIVYSNLWGGIVLIYHGTRNELKYQLKNNFYGFTFGEYNPGFPLKINSVIFVYAGFIGGIDNKVEKGIAVEEVGYKYSIGYTHGGEWKFSVPIGQILIGMETMRKICTSDEIECL